MTSPSLRPDTDRRRVVAALSILAGSPLLVLASRALAAARVPLSEVARPGRVLIIRHAQAPGIGDPPEFRIGDCMTQRNLDEAGRAQAGRIGQRLRQAGVVRAQVWSSQWCRCLDTARLLELGPASELPALNSFFGRPEVREAQLAALRVFLAGLPAGGLPVVLVTHQVVITALTGLGVASGGGAVLQLNGTGTPRLLGEIEVD